MYDGKKQELQTAQRDLGAFARNGRKEYTNWIASNVQTVVTANSQSTSKSKVPTGPTNINTKEMKLSEPNKFSVSTQMTGRSNSWVPMEDMALEWYEPYSLERDRLLAIRTPDTNELNRRNQEFDDFLSKLDETFKNPIELTNRRINLQKVRQANMEFSEYVIHFRGLGTKAEIEPNHQVQLFMNSLNLN
ncbi:hypothetical protein SeMB42_g06783 [Synchytrium endobioticum]|uniref:Retrotransposon gag domain-containing protein n=1 Tax=Synchytrium endobioticum TaxID=286115 RepID=A0A507CJG2_9FUNG|nr:hypothetical protein SeMB42_g06783 [Synchytrium endobioticum]TPX50975.1 hypothetical protein SeLEV6574_g00578 [Synchytrium endobioticum]